MVLSASTDIRLVASGKLYIGEMDKVIKLAITNEGHKDVKLPERDILRREKNITYIVFGQECTAFM